MSKLVSKRPSASGLVLVSASERRRKILKSLGLKFDIAVPHVREVSHIDDPLRTAAENALLKSKWARTRYPDCTTVTADTVIGFKGRVIGKPADFAEAHEFLRRFSGARHTVITAVAIAIPAGSTELHVVESEVSFRKLTDREIREYIAVVNPLDKAGGYDIDQQGDLIIESFSGSRTNIMGLPREVVKEWLATRAAGSRSGRGAQPATRGRGRKRSPRRPRTPAPPPLRRLK